MAGNMINNPRPQFLDGNGDPYALGTLSFFDADAHGTPLDTYSDKALTVANANPVVLDAAGRPASGGTEIAIFLQQQSYYVVLKDSSGTEIWDADDVSNILQISFTGPLQQPNIAGMTAILKANLSDNQQCDVAGHTTIGDAGGGKFYWDSSSSATANSGTIIASDEGGTGRWLRVFVGAHWMEWFGNIGDGSTDNSTDMTAAIDAVETAGGGTLMIGDGDFRFATGQTLKDEVTIRGVGKEAAILTYTGTADALSGDDLRHPGMSNLTLQATSTPTAGIRLNGCFWGVFRDLMIKSFNNVATTAKGMYLEGTDGANGSVLHSTFENINFGKGSETCDFGLYIKTISGAQNRINANNFINIQSRFCLADGVYVDGATGNTFIGGAFENNASAGVRWFNDCVNNVQIGGLFENNPDGDIVFDNAGTVTGAQLYGCDLTSTIKIGGAGAQGTGHVYFFGNNTTGLDVNTMFAFSMAIENLFAKLLEFNDQTSGTSAIILKVLGDTNTRLLITNDGTIKAGSGSAPVDFEVERTSVGVFRSTGIWIDNSDTAADGDTTPSVEGVRHLSIPSNTGGTAITQLDDGVAGQTVTIYITNATNPSTIADGGNFKLSAAWSPGIDDNITLHTLNGSTWNEVGRSDN